MAVLLAFWRAENACSVGAVSFGGEQCYYQGLGHLRKFRSMSSNDMFICLAGTKCENHGMLGPQASIGTNIVSTWHVQW